MSKTKYTIGRDRNADIPIADESVSRLHAELSILDGGRLFLTDCRSSNGTRILRGSQTTTISQETLRPTDRVQFGNVILPVSDLLETIERKYPGRKADQPARAEPVITPGARLVRCDCGAVKPESGPCPACG